MTLHNFDPTEHSLEELIEFGERMEVVEGNYNATFQLGSDDKDDKKPKAKTKKAPKHADWLHKH